MTEQDFLLLKTLDQTQNVTQRTGNHTAYTLTSWHSFYTRR